MCSVAGSPLTWVQPVGSSAVDVILDGVRASSFASAKANAFVVKVRVASNDRFVASWKADVAIVHACGDSWAALHAPSDVRNVSVAQAKLLSSPTKLLGHDPL